jgi:hypothetical protein
MQRERERGGGGGNENMWNDISYKISSQRKEVCVYKHAHMHAYAMAIAQMSQMLTDKHIKRPPDIRHYFHQ